MANRRTPRAKAIVSGRIDKDPQRFRDRAEPRSPRLGNPPAWMPEDQAEAWRQFARELPWLTESHRALMEITVSIRARVISGKDVGIQAMNLLRLCLGQLGATPVDATKVTVPDDGEEDPEEALFRPLN